MSGSEDDESTGEDTLPELSDKEKEVIRDLQKERDAQIHDYFRKANTWPRR